MLNLRKCRDSLVTSFRYKNMFNSTRKLLINTEALPKTLIKKAYYMFFFPVEVNQALGAAYLLGFSGSL